MQNMLHPHTGPLVPMVVTCWACASDRHFFLRFGCVWLSECLFFLPLMINIIIDGRVVLLLNVLV